MDAVEKWRRLSHPTSPDDYGLSVTLKELLESEGGLEIVENEIIPMLCGYEANK